jgi:ATP adenylyltransferase
MEFIQGGGPKDLPEKPDKGFLRGADKDCFICQGVADPDDSRRRVIEVTDHSITLLNRFPYNNGHLLIAPKEHHGELEELKPEVEAEISRTLRRMVSALRVTLNPQGFNIGLNLGLAAGAGLPGHLHWHIVPRWNGDTNFMPAMGAGKIIPQSLDALMTILTDQLAKSE